MYGAAPDRTAGACRSGRFGADGVCGSPVGGSWGDSGCRGHNYVPGHAKGAVNWGRTVDARLREPWASPKRNGAAGYTTYYPYLHCRPVALGRLGTTLQSAGG